MKIAIEVEKTIIYWERVLFDYQFLIEPATKVLIEATICQLKELKKFRKGNKVVARVAREDSIEVLERLQESQETD